MSSAASRRGHAGRLFRYGWAATGPISIAVCQFILSLQLLHVLQPGAFGTFAFLMVTSQFSAGVWSALFCAPLPVLFNEGDESHRQRMSSCLFATNLFCAGVAFLIFAALGMSLGLSPQASLLFAVYAAVSLLRWYARAFAYTTGSPLKATVSDIAFSVSLLAGVVGLARSGFHSVEPVYAIMAASVSIGIATFGVGYMRRQICDVSPRNLLSYADVWRRHSSWSLAGVVSTEATGNAHAYLVTFLVGPSAFAPVAAAALLIRPIAVVMNALTDFERPQIARCIERNDIGAARHAMTLFRLVLLAVWLSCVVGGIALLRFSPHLIFPARYSIDYLVLGAILWMLVAGVRLIKVPESVLLQSAGVFRWLAYASIVSSGISIVAVVIFLVVGGPMWSILGVVLGEIVFTILTKRRARSWLANQGQETTETNFFSLPPAAPSVRKPLSRQA